MALDTAIDATALQALAEQLGRATAQFQSSGQLTARIGAYGVPYARYHHDGTRPHLIVPRTARALYWPGARHPVALVHHPGTKANPFIQDAYDVHIQGLTRDLATEAANIVTGERASGMATVLATGAANIAATAQQRVGVRSGNLRDHIRWTVGR